jgi:hypothetical protein
MPTPSPGAFMRRLLQKMQADAAVIGVLALGIGLTIASLLLVLPPDSKPVKHSAPLHRPRS